MSATIVRKSPIDDFAQKLKQHCPFASNRVSDAARAMPPDVATIHGREFVELSELVAHSSHRCGLGVMLWGEPGVGKSHLLARLYHDLGRQACFTFLHNVQVSPDRLPRYVLKSVVQQLARGRQGTGSLRDLLVESIQSILGTATVNLNGAYTAYRQAFIANDEVPTSEDQELVYEVLFAYLRHRLSGERKGDQRAPAAELAVNWLSGDQLDDQQLDALQLPDRIRHRIRRELPDDHAIEAVLHAIANISSRAGRTFVVLFDQADNLDAEQVGAWARFAHTLIDHLPNLLVITSGVRGRLLEMQHATTVNTASWDRIAQRRVEIGRITPQEARELLQARLKPFIQPFLKVARMDQLIDVDSLFPLGTDWWQQQFADALDVRPRDVVSWADARCRQISQQIRAMGFTAWLASWPNTGLDADMPKPERLQATSAAIDAKVEAKLREQRQLRLVNPDTLPADASNLLGLVERLLQQCTQPEQDYSLRTVKRSQQCRGNASTFDLWIEDTAASGQLRTTGLKFVATGSKTSACAALSRLMDPPLLPDLTLVITDQRLPMQLGEKGRSYLEHLKQRGQDAFGMRELSFDMHAQLDALQGVVGLANSGDIEVEQTGQQPHVLTGADVIASHHRLDRYRAHALLRELLGEVTTTIVDDSGLEVCDQAAEAEYATIVDTAAGESITGDSTEVHRSTLSDQRPGLILGVSNQGDSLRLPLEMLPSHVALVGAAGSGKTWMAKVVVEEAISQGVPVIAIDPQGDLVQFLRPSSSSKNLSQNEREYFWNKCETRIYTPGSSHGSRLSVDPLRLPHEQDLARITDPQRRAEELEGMFGATVANIVNVVNSVGDRDLQATFLLQVIRRLIDPSKPRKAVLSLRDLAAAVMAPNDFGIHNADAYLPKRHRDKLGRKLMTLLEGPNANLFLGGQPLNIDALCRPDTKGKTPLNVIYLNALTSDDQREFFVASLATELYRWMITSLESTGQAKLLFYIDEARDFIPAGARKPMAKDPLIRLFSQGRKYGVSCLICTQSPRSVDYNIFSNCSTKLVGRLESAQDVDRVAEWFSTDGGRPTWLSERKAAPRGTFVARWPDMPPQLAGVAVKGRPLFSLHEGAWSPDRVEREFRANAERLTESGTDEAAWRPVSY